MTAAAPRGRGVSVLFAAGVAANAALLFAVEPLVSRQLLPLLGGTPSVWNSCLMTFQALLLAGYLYAHALARRAVRTQAIVHLSLFALSLLALPVLVREGGAPHDGWPPAAWVVRLLLGAVGVPFLVLSAGAPLLQRWYAAWREARDGAMRDATTEGSGDATYALYAASNAGSLLALVGYPLLIEPRLGLGAQARGWSVLFAALGALLAACALVAARGGVSPRVATAPSSADASAVAPTIGMRARWTLLAFVPSALLLALTRYLTTDVAPVPLLWLVPLAIYLLTFVLAFAPRGHVPAPLLDRATTTALPLLALLVALDASSPLALISGVHLLAFAIVALWCHQALADARPPVARLTEYYLWLSLGGLLGGVFNALLAPLLFSGLAEYPIAVAMAAAARLLVRPASPVVADGVAVSAPRTRLATRLLQIGDARVSAPTSRVALLARRALVPLGVALMVYAAASRAASDGRGMAATTALCGGAALLLCVVSRAERWTFALAVVAVVGGGALGQRARQASVLLRARSFYGAYTVRTASPLHYLQHGTTLHGAQDLSPSRRTTPLSYYHREGPLGVLLTTVPRLAPGAPPRRVAAVGLGTGTVACHGRAGERWTFYEIDPLMERIARDPRLFTYLRDCPPTVHVVLGDARLSLGRAPRGSYDLIVLDAFSSDAIPTHLLTREAVATYVAALAPGGVLAVHISNRFLDLGPVVGALAADAGLVALLGRDVSDAYRREVAVTTSRWIAVARRPQDLGVLATLPGWTPLTAPRGTRPWTDDYANVLAAVRWR